MRKALKQIFAGFIYSIMTLSFILSPIPRVNVTYAEEAQNCYNAEEDGSGQNQVYRQGCDFDEVMNKTDLQDTGSVHGGSIGAKAKQIFQQYVVGLFGLVLLNSLDFKYTPRSVADCPVNRVADTSMRAAQLSSLSFVIGDLIANMRFKAAAKEANDMAFSFTARPTVPTEEEIEQALANGEEDPRLVAVRQENEQIQAFDTLISIYEKQLSGIKTKLALATLAEAGFLITEGIEMVGKRACKMKCDESYNRANGDILSKKTQYETQAGKVSGLVGQISAYACAAQLAPGVCETAKGTLQAACSGVHAPTQAMGRTMDSILSQSRHAGTIDKQQKEAFHLRLAAWFTSFIANLASKIDLDSDPDVGIVTPSAEAAKQAAAGAAALAEQEANALTIRGASRLVRTAASTCENAAMTAATVLPQATRLAAELIRLEIKGQFYSRALLEGPNMAVPVLCCGTDLSVSPEDLANSFVDGPQLRSMFQENVQSIMSKNGNTEFTQDMLSSMQSEFGQSMADLAVGGAYLTHYPTMADDVPYPSVYHKQQDIVMEGLFSGNSSGSQGSSSSFNVEDYLEDLTYNALMKFALNQVKLDTKNPKASLGQVAQASQKVHQIMDFQRKALANSAGQEELQKKFKNFLKNKDLSNKKSIMEEMSNFFMQEAHAINWMGLGISAGINQAPGLLGIDGQWAELFNLGSKLMFFQSLLKKFARETALISPTARTWTWMALIAATGATIVFDAEAAKITQERIDMAKAERDRYLKSARGDTSIDEANEGEDRDGSGRLTQREGRRRLGISGTANVQACAAPRGNGFAPASCNSEIPRSAFQIDNVDRQLQANLDPSHVQGMGTLSNLVGDAATGNPGNEGLSDAQLAQVRSVSSAVRKANEKLRKDLDKKDARGKKGSKSSNGSLQTMHAKMKKLLGNPNGASSADLASISAPFSAPFKPEEAGEEEGSGFTKTSAFGDHSGGAAKPPSVPEFSFGDYGEGAVDSQAEAAALNPEENLGDFVLDHDDINKKKDVSIFKILSNRYLLSYPKVLEEEKPQQ